jgi:hypothetical protein
MGYFFSLFSLSKSATETALNVAELVIIVSGLLLAFGAIGEYLEEHGRLVRWMAWPKLVFIVLVVASLIGEFLGDAGVFVFSEHLQFINDAEANVLREKLGGEIGARLALEKEFIWQGPRDIPLLAAQGQFDTNLKAFVGQRFRISACELDLTGGGPSPFGSTTADMINTVDALFEDLTHAGWQTALPLPIMRRGIGCISVGVAVHPDATPQTRQAAQALTSVLHDVLREHKGKDVGTTAPTDFPPENQLPGDVIEVGVGRHLAHPFSVP